MADQPDDHYDEDNRNDESPMSMFSQMMSGLQNDSDETIDFNILEIGPDGMPIGIGNDLNDIPMPILRRIAAKLSSDDNVPSAVINSITEHIDERIRRGDHTLITGGAHLPSDVPEGDKSTHFTLCSTCDPDANAEHRSSRDDLLSKIYIPKGIDGVFRQASRHQIEAAKALEDSSIHTSDGDRHRSYQSLLDARRAIDRAIEAHEDWRRHLAEHHTERPYPPN